MKTQLMTTAALAALAGPSLAQCEVQELVPVGLTPWYGYAVAVAGDVAAVSDPSGADGRVHVFERGATSWEYVVALGPQAPWDSMFGSAVAADGDRIVVGDYRYGDLDDQYGQVDVFERQGGAWVHRNNLSVFAVQHDHYGFDVDIDGDWVACGADADYEQVAWAFKLLPNGGFQKQSFSAPGGGTYGFGRSVGVDGDWLAIADPYYGPSSATGVGRIYLYELLNGHWQFSQYLYASDSTPGHQFGTDLDIDNGRMVVGLGAGSGLNRAYVYEYRGGSWIETATLEVPTGSIGAAKLSLSGDRALLRTRESGGEPGAGWLFEFDSGQWTLASKFSVANAPPAVNLFKAVAMSQGNIVMSSLFNSAADGAAWIFDLSGGGQNHNYCTAVPNSTGQASTITYQGSTSISGNDFKLVATGAIPGQFGLFFYGSAESLLPFGQGNLCIGGQLSRLNPPVQCDGNGRAQRVLDFTVPPANAGVGGIAPGSMKYFQFWYRDPASGAGQFNLSDGLAVSFCQ